MELKSLWPGWKTVRIIGSGGFGKVYEIKKDDDSGEFSSALKVISIPQSEEEYKIYKDDGYDEESITAIFKSRMEDVVSEFKVMAQFSGTANIVSYLDHMVVPHEDGKGWDVLIRMELLKSLPDYVNNNNLSEEKIIQLGLDICSALELCSKRNIIHRDIKPQNVFINDFGDFKLGDFGIAKTMDHTTHATKVGTVNYMVPEVYNNQPYNSTVDIYSLGLVMYWLLNERRLPFLPLPPQVPTAAENSDAQAKRLRGEPIPEPKNGPTALKEIVRKALSFYPQDRYQSASEMRRALLGLLSTPPDAASGADDQTPENDKHENEEDSSTFSIMPSKITKQEEEEEPKSVIEPEPVLVDLDEQTDEPNRVSSPNPSRVPRLMIIIGVVCLLLISSVIGITQLNKKAELPPEEPKKEEEEEVTEEEEGEEVTEEEGEEEEEVVDNPEKIVAVFAGYTHTVGLKSDGTVVATGENDFGECDVDDWENIIAISTGERYYTIGLKKDGTVVATGTNTFGECDVDDWEDIIAISTGEDYTIGLKKDGTVVATGRNGLGQCDVDDWEDIIQVSTDDFRTVGLKSDGTVVATGTNIYGECDVDDWEDIIQVSTGSRHTVGLKSDGTVVATGDNEFGQCDVDDWEDIIAISASDSTIGSNIGLKKDGTVVAAGLDKDDVDDWEDIIQVSSDSFQIVGLKSDGTVVAIGANAYGECDVDDWEDIIQVSIGGDHTVGLKSDGTVVATGDNEYGQCDVSDWYSVAQDSDSE